MTHRVEEAPEQAPDERAAVVRLASAASQEPRTTFFAALIAGMFWLFTVVGVIVLAELIGTVSSLVAAGAAFFSFVLGGLAARHAVLTLRARHAIIGNDGVSFVGAFDRLYLSFAEIAHVRLEPNGVSLTTGAGVVVMLPVAAATYRGTLAASDDPLLARRNELHDWIRHARRRYQDAPRPPPMEDLDRGERSLEAWQSDLRRLSAGASPYRGTPIALDELRRIIEDPYAPPARRVAAAFVMAGRSASDSARATQLALQRSADPDLRMSLDSASRQHIDEQAIERISARHRRGR